MGKSNLHYAYIVRCSDNSLYSGYTTDTFRRTQEHNSGLGAKYTRARRPVELVYFESFDNTSEAMKREAQFKKLTHTEKELLIKTKNSGA